MEQSKTEKASQLLREKEVFEKNKPIVDISTPAVVQTDSSLDISFFVRNRGTSNMEDVLVYLKAKKITNTSEVANTTWSFARLKTGDLNNFDFTVLNWQKDSILCYVDVRYKWPVMKFEGSEKKSFVCGYDKTAQKYDVRVLDDKDHRKFWGER